MFKNKWREVSIGDKLYVLTYPPLMLTFRTISVPEVFTAHVENIDGDETNHSNNPSLHISAAEIIQTKRLELTSIAF